MRGLYLVYGIIAYLLFLAAIIYGIGFVGGINAKIEVPKKALAATTETAGPSAKDAKSEATPEPTAPAATDAKSQPAADATGTPAADGATPAAVAAEEPTTDQVRIFPRTVDGPVAPTTTISVIVINLLLLGAFAVQHNVMARSWFKKGWTKIIPKPIERSTYVALSSLLLMLLYWKWQPIPEPIWDVTSAPLRAVIWTVYGLGWLLVFYSTFVIDHFELFGLKQVMRHFRGLPDETADFSSRSLYRWIRHPLMLGFLIAFWAAPTMTFGRLIFALVCTIWIFFSIMLEERDLALALGEPYRDYRARTSMILPLPRGGKRGE
jgi:protein-S-isoprenylcysteine O-methyltransferase Ste14